MEEEKKSPPKLAWWFNYATWYLEPLLPHNCIHADMLTSNCIDMMLPGDWGELA